MIEKNAFDVITTPKRLLKIAIGEYEFPCVACFAGHWCADFFIEDNGKKNWVKHRAHLVFNQGKYYVPIKNGEIAFLLAGRVMYEMFPVFLSRVDCEMQYPKSEGYVATKCNVVIKE